MPDATAAVIGGSSLIGGTMQGQASERAAELQAATAREQLGFQREVFERGMASQQPFQQIPLRPGESYFDPAVTLARPGQQAARQLSMLLGLPETDQFGNLIGVQTSLGEGQLQAIQAIERDPIFQARVKQGEDALLAQASATGGLRGGNIQAALAQFRPQLLSEEISNRIAQLSGIAEAGSGQQLNALRIGQAAASGQVSAGNQFSSNLGQTMAQLGSAQAARAQSGGQATLGQAFSSVPTMIGTYQGLTGQSLFPAPIIDRSTYSR